MSVIVNPEARGLLSCDLCRRLKVKCVRSRAAEPCNKCTRTETLCVTSHSRRPNRTSSRASRTRIADLGSKLNSMLDILSRDHPSQKRTESDSSLGDDSGAGLEHFTNSHFDQSIERCWNLPLGLSEAVVKHLLSEHRQRQTHFPFVVIPNDWSLMYLSHERPFLLLAAITAASSERPHLQAKLAEIFRSELATRVIVHGEKNLDLLQGLLVHLAWFHFCSRARSQQAYQYLQLAISMVVDLNLDGDPASLTENRHEIFVQHPLLRDVPNMAIEIAGKEAQRAFLGCCLLSSVISYFLGKPNKLPIANHALNCAEYLQQAPQYASDKTLLYIIELQQLADDINGNYTAERSSQTRHRHRLLTIEKNFQSRLVKWQEKLPFDLYESDWLRLRYHAVQVMIHEVGLIHCFGRQRTLYNNGQFIECLGSTETLAGTFQSCLMAAKAYLDCTLTILEKHVSQLPFEEWTRLILALFVLYKLSLGVPDVPEWNPERAREMCDLQHYLTQMLTCFKSVNEQKGASRHTMFHMLPAILESTKTAFSLICQHPHMFPQGIQAHTLGPQDDIKSSTPQSSASNCPGFQHLASLAKQRASGSNATFMALVDMDIQAIERLLAQ